MTRHRLDHVERPRIRPEAADALRSWIDAAADHTPTGVDEERLLDRAREQVAFHVGARPHEVVFTSGATESATMAVAGLLDRVGGGHVVCSTGERPSLLAAVQRHADEVTWLEPEPTGWVDHQRVLGEVRASTSLVCLAMADHRLGVRQPVEPLIGACRDRRIPMLVDTSVAAGRCRLDQWATRPDLLVVDGHQLAGVPGIGALVVRRGVRIESHLTTTAGERDRRSGTPNLPGAIGLGAAAAALSPKVLAAEQRRRCDLHRRLGRRLRGVGHRVIEVEGVTLDLGIVVDVVDADATTAVLDRLGVVVERLDERHIRCAAAWSSTPSDLEAAADALAARVRPATGGC